MTPTTEGTLEARPRDWVAIALALLAPMPWLGARALGIHPDPLTTVALSGVCILAAAFMLSWAAEVAQMDISQSLAMVFLALIAILPEYSVDMTFAWKAAQDPAFAPYAIANMTGANRLLIGLGWSSVILIAAWRTRSRAVDIGPGRFIELGFLWAATAYSLLLPLKRTLSLMDAVVLVALFAYYVRVASKLEHVEPELVGPSVALGAQPPRRRRMAVVSFFLVAAVAIFLAAEPFAHGLVTLGKQLRVDEFLLVQWVAPLASETPEFLVAGMLAFRGQGRAGIGVMISSKVNQWTLLVGLLPVVYALGLLYYGKAFLTGIHLDLRQTEELFLTSAQSAFAAALLQRGHISWRGALALLVLFLGQFMVTSEHDRMIFAALYLVFTSMVLGWHFLLHERRRA